MTPTSKSRSASALKAREVPYYASRYASMITSGIDSPSQSTVDPANISQVHTKGSSRPLSIETTATSVRSSSRSAKDKRGQGKEARAQKRASKNIPSVCLTQPLSQIAHETSGVSVADVTAFANRSVEVRQQEAAKAAKIKRPLNAFMLYRKAYQDIAKSQCSRNNHQQVSTVCGSSWNCWEPPGVIAHFKQLASVEKQMHEDAFPAYKYDPVQVKRSKDGIEQDTGAPCDASDGESGCRRRRGDRPKATRSISRRRYSLALDASTQDIGSFASQEQGLGGPWNTYHAPVFPEWYSHSGLPSNADQYSVRGVQQSNMVPLDTPYDFNPSESRAQPYPTFIDPCLDPSLQPTEPVVQYGHVPGNAGGILTGWGGFHDPALGPMALIPDLDVTGAHNAYLQGSDGDWQVEQLEDGSHFSDWMMQTGHSL